MTSTVMIKAVPEEEVVEEKLNGNNISATKVARMIRTLKTKSVYMKTLITVRKLQKT